VKQNRVGIATVFPDETLRAHDLSILRLSERNRFGPHHCTT
jgi:hypothetical protein